MANNVNRESVVKSAMSRAAKLMQLESNGTLDKIATAHRDGINTSLDDSSMLSQDLMTTATNRMTEAPTAQIQMGGNAINVPSAIRESFANMQIDETALYAGLGGADSGLNFLDEMGGQKQAAKNIAPTQDVRQIISEGMPSMVSTQPQTVQQVDYPTIRTIVEEIVRKYAVSLKKNILSESKQTAQLNQVNTIALGKTFKFLDESGNIYECTMKKIGNVKNKKSVNG